MQVLSRQELFERAWRQPLTKVAAELGVTSTALKKTCGRHDIPVPGRGYWTQVAAGKVFPRPKLRPVKDTRLEQVRILGGARPPAAVLEAAGKARAAAAAIATAQATEAAPAAEHRELAATRKALARAKPSGARFLYTHGAGVVGMKIGEVSVERTLLWLERFLQAAEGQGHRFAKTEAGAALLVDGEAIGFRIDEIAERTPHTPTAKELAEKAKWEHIYSATWRPWPKYDHSPSGRLLVAIEANTFAGLRRTFSDGKTRRVEALIPDILGAFAAHAALIQQRAREAQVRRREAEAAAARQARVKAFEGREARRGAFVDAVAGKLAERARLAAVLQHLEPSSGDGKERLSEMAAWVGRRMAELDALLSPQFLDLSARHARIDFDEARAAAQEATANWYYPSAVELQFWSVDEAHNQATSQSALEWAQDAGLLPNLAEEPTHPEEM